MVLRHYTKVQGDHYICLRSTPNFDCSEYQYEEPTSYTDNIQTELDIPVIWPTYKLNVMNITLTWITCKLNSMNITVTFTTYKLN